MSTQTDIAARTVLQEARGEGQTGMVAVAWSIRNRLATGRWGNSLASVCLWHAQYSGWWSPRQVNGKSYRDPNFAYATGLRDDDPALLKAIQIVEAVTAASPTEDVTGRATHYYSTDIPAPAWADSMTFTVQIGKHRFYQEGLVA